MNFADLRATLHAYRDFQECIVADFRWLHHGTVVEVDMDYIWGTDGSVREDDAPRLFVTIRTESVLDLRVQNRLNTAQVENPSRINWGSNEVSSVVAEAAPGAEFGHPEIPLYKLTWWWETGPWIEIVCAGIRFEERFGEGNVERTP